NSVSLDSASGFVWNFFRRDPARSDFAQPAVIDVRRRTPKMARLEAVLFVADEALATRRLVQLATLADVTEAEELIERLNAAYDADASAFRVERVEIGRASCRERGAEQGVAGASEEKKKQ